MTKDSVIFDIIRRERERQTKGIELIASENFVSDQVMEAMGSVLIKPCDVSYRGYLDNEVEVASVFTVQLLLNLIRVVLVNIENYKLLG